MNKLAFTDLELGDTLERISHGSMYTVEELGQDSVGPYVGLLSSTGTSSDKSLDIIARDLSDFTKVNSVLTFDARFTFDAAEDIKAYVDIISKYICEEDWDAVTGSIEDFCGVHGCEETSLEKISPLSIYSCILPKVGRDQALDFVLQYSKCSDIFNKESFSEGLYSLMRNKGGEPYNLAPSGAPKPSGYAPIDKPAFKYSANDIMDFPVRFTFSDEGAKKLTIGEIVDIIGEGDKPLRYNRDADQWEIIVYDRDVADALENYLQQSLSEGDFQRLGELDIEMDDSGAGGHGSFFPADAIEMGSSPKVKRKRIEKLPSTSLDTVNWLDKLVSYKTSAAYPNTLTLYCITSQQDITTMKKTGFVIEGSSTSDTKLYTNRAAATFGFKQKHAYGNIDAAVLLKLHVPTEQLAKGTITFDTIVRHDILK